MFIGFSLAGLVRIEEGVVFLPNQSKIAPSLEVWQMTTFKIYDLLYSSIHIKMDSQGR
jgi:hypothetical protein